ncbi:MAG: type II toxin-antitoxin system VapC family toxin [Chloroflexota bacterium]|jgi:hypothetical protein
MLIIDSDILIDAGRKDSAAKQFIMTAEANGSVYISAITQMELLVGARNKEELREITKFIQRFIIIPITQLITEEAVQLLTTYRLAYGLAIADALVAATAKVNNYVLATKNRKDFHYITDLQFADYP